MTVALLAFLITFIPPWRAYLPFLGSAAISEETSRIQALAAAQSYTATTVLVDPLVVYLDDFLSAAELDDLLNSTCGPPLLFHDQR